MFNISEENKKFLIELSEKINKQDNRATQYPLFQVRTKKRIYGEQGWRDECERKEDDSIEFDMMCKKCQELYKKDEELPNWCEECDSVCFAWYSLEYTPVEDCGLFFTAKAAQRHIDENSYHYTDPIVYGIGAWRNPEMQKVMQIISSLTTEDEKPRDCYK